MIVHQALRQPKVCGLVGMLRSWIDPGPSEAENASRKKAASAPISPRNGCDAHRQVAASPFCRMSQLPNHCADDGGHDKRQHDACRSAASENKFRTEKRDTEECLDRHDSEHDPDNPDKLPIHARRMLQ